MDFGPDKSDAQILLDYGVLDADNPQVRYLNWHACGRVQDHLVPSM